MLNSLILAQSSQFLWQYPIVIHVIALITH